MPFVIEGPDSNPTGLVDSPTLLDPRDLLGDLPPFEQSSRDIQGVLTALGNELARIEAARQDLIANFFPRTALALLHYYEQMLGLPTDPPMLTVADRRAAILAFMQAMKSSGSAVSWAASLSSLIGTGWSFQLHDPSDPTSPAPYVILLRIPYAGPATVPAGVNAVVAGAGTLAAGTYYYAVTAYTGYGETLPSALVAVSLSSASTVHVTWTPSSTPTVGYRVYRGLSPSTLQQIADISDATVGTFSDDGTPAPGVSPPTEDSSGSMRAGAALKLARAITPAHLGLDVGYRSGFIIGVSAIGIEPL